MVTPRYLLDTDSLSEPLKPKPRQGFLRKLRTNEGRLAVAVTTWHEALFGLFRLPEGQRRERVREYLFEIVAPAVPVLSYDAAAAEWHARERARLGSLGRTPPFADGQIAAVAKVHGLTLVTANTKHFAAFEGVELESW